MAWNKEQVQRLLDQVVSTSGRESARKAEELLSYVANGTNKESDEKAVPYNSAPSADTKTSHESQD